METACQKDMSVFDIRNDAAESRAGEEVPGPLDGDREVGMSTGEAQEMDEHPRAPCDEARHLLRHYPSPRNKLTRACHIYLGLLTG